MPDKDLEIVNLTKDVARWKNRALEACEKACFHCEEYISKTKELCASCRITKIRQEASE